MTRVGWEARIVCVTLDWFTVPLIEQRRVRDTWPGNGGARHATVRGLRVPDDSCRHQSDAVKFAISRPCPWFFFLRGKRLWRACFAVHCTRRLKNFLKPSDTSHGFNDTFWWRKNNFRARSEDTGVTIGISPSHEVLGELGALRLWLPHRESATAVAVQ